MPKDTKEAKDASALTEKQKRFCAEYLIDLNASAAYRRAGYVGSANTIKAGAHQLLKKPRISAEVLLQQTKLQQKTGITQERVLAELAKLAFVDPRKFYDEQGNLIPVHLLDADTAATLAGMDVAEINSIDGPIGQTKKIKMADKKSALDSLARHLGMFQDKIEMTGKNGGPIAQKVDVSIAPEDAYLRMIGK